MAYQTSVIVPDKGIRAAKNSTGADIATAVLVSIVAAGTEDPTQIRLPTAAGVKIFGCVMAAQGIKDGQIGDIQVEGRTRVLAGAGGIAVGQEVSATTAGAAVAATTGHVIAGVCVKAAAAGAYGEVELGTAIAGRVVP
jgi:hypothetical protein